jgi:hypothetical protein
MTILLSYLGSTRSYNLSMPSTGFDYVSKFAGNIDTLLEYVYGIDRKGFILRKAKQVSDRQKRSALQTVLGKMKQQVDVVRLDAAIANNLKEFGYVG